MIGERRSARASVGASWGASCGALPSVVEVVSGAGPAVRGESGASETGSPVSVGGAGGAVLRDTRFVAVFFATGGVWTGTSATAATAFFALDLVPAVFFAALFVAALFVAEVLLAELLVAADLAGAVSGDEACVATFFAAALVVAAFFAALVVAAVLAPASFAAVFFAEVFVAVVLFTAVFFAPVFLAAFFVAFTGPSVVSLTQSPRAGLCAFYAPPCARPRRSATTRLNSAAAWAMLRALKRSLNARCSAPASSRRKSGRSYSSFTRSASAPVSFSG